MSLSLTRSVKEAKVDETFNEFVYSYMDGDKDVTELSLLEECMLTAKWIGVRYNFPHDFNTITDVSMEFLVNLRRKAITISPFKSLNNLISNHGKISLTMSDKTAMFSDDSVSMEYMISVKDQLRRSTNDLTSSDRAIVLYEFLYGESNYEKLLQSNLRKLLIWKSLSTMNANLGIEETKGMEFSIPESHSSKILILEALRNLSDPTMSLFVLLKDPTKFYEFISLYGGKTIDIPTLSDVGEIFSKSSYILEKLESNIDLTVKDRERLSKLAGMMDPVTKDISVPESLEHHLTSTIETSVKGYNDLVDTLVEKVNKGRTDVNQAYGTLNKEFSVQSRLLKEIVQISGGLDKINQIIEDMSIRDS